MKNNWLNETKRWMGILVENGDILYTDKLLTESQESKSIDAAKKLVIQRLKYTPKQADEFIRIELRDNLPVLRDKNAAKFILGATRMFLDRQLRDASAISALNTTLKYVASDAHYNEYDRNLNGISAQDLIQRFAKNIEMDLENDRNKVNSMQFEGQSQYDIVRIDSFEQACEYNKYTYKDSQWCLTYGKGNYDTYSCNGVNQIYFCLRKGFENVEPVPGEGCPLDEYGLSMISIIVNEKGALAFCTSRWNHANGGNDHVMDDTTKISEVIGMKFYEVFKPNNKWNEMVENAIQRVRNGENPKDVFDYCGPFQNGFARVKLNKKCNLIKQDGSLVSPNQWFDECYNFREGFAVVRLNGKYNFITQDGSLIRGDFNSLDQWFDNCNDFINGFAVVELNRKQNFIKPDGSLLWDKPVEEWFGHCGYFMNGLARVQLNGKYNFIKPDGNFLWDKPVEEWFGYCYDFREGFAVVRLNRKYNFITQDGSLMRGDFNSLDQWFDDCENFKDGLAIVKLNGKWNYIKQDGSLMRGDFNSLDQWFDSCDIFENGFARVELNRKRYFIDTEGNLYGYYNQEPLGINVKTMNIQNESVRDILTNMIVENVMRRILIQK